MNLNVMKSHSTLTLLWLIGRKRGPILSPETEGVREVHLVAVEGRLKEFEKATLCADRLPLKYSTYTSLFFAVGEVYLKQGLLVAILRGLISSALKLIY